MTIGRYLRRARQSVMLSTRALAALVDVTHPHIVDIEHDRKAPTHQLLERMAEHVPMDMQEARYLLGRLTAEAEALIGTKAGADLVNRLARIARRR